MLDKFEIKVLTITGIIVAIFIFTILYTAGKRIADVPECIPYNASYAEPHISKIDDSTYQVFVVAQMWSFNPSQIYIPVGSTVDFYVTSKDVVHGFFIDSKNVNMMAEYGNVTKTTVKFTEPGIYPIVCHEYCGVGHQNMHAEVIVNYPRTVNQ